MSGSSRRDSSSLVSVVPLELPAGRPPAVTGLGAAAGGPPLAWSAAPGGEEDEDEKLEKEEKVMGKEKEA